MIVFVFHGETDKPPQIALIMVRNPRNFPPFFIFKASFSSHCHLMRGIFSGKVFIFHPCFDVLSFASVTRLYMQAPRGCNGVCTYMSDSACSSERDYGFLCLCFPPRVTEVLLLVLMSSAQICSLISKNS